jgi:hypothetical protein
LHPSTAQHNAPVTVLQVVTKGKPKQLPHVLESGAILELGNFCCECDQEVPLEEFK